MKQTTNTSKSSNPKDSTDKEMSLIEAEKFLRKVGEWHDVVKMDRETIIKWATFLKNKEEQSK